MRIKIISHLMSFLVVIPSLCSGQKILMDVSKMHTLDTIIYIPSVGRVDFRMNGIKFCHSKKDEILINYYNAKIHEDTFRLIRLNTKSYLLDSFDIILKGFVHNFKEHKIMSFDYYQSVMAILLHEKIIIVELDENFRVKSFKSVPFKNGEGYQEAKFCNDTVIILSRSYDYFSPKQSFSNTKISLFDWRQESVVKSIDPYVSNLELSHVKPYSTLSVLPNRILVGQNSAFAFRYYDNGLNFNGEYIDQQKFVGKNIYDSAELAKVQRFSRGDKTPLLRYLQSNHASGKAFVDGYFFIEEEKVLIRYTLGENERETLTRQFQIVKFDMNSQTYKSQDTIYVFKQKFGVVQDESIDTLQISKESYTVNIWLNPIVFFPEKTLVFEKDAFVYPIGLRRAEFAKKRKEFYEKSDAVFSVTVLKNNF